MPIIHLIDGSKKTVKYSKASQLNQYLNDPDKLNDIRCGKCARTADDLDKPQCSKCMATRKEKENFLGQVANIDWSDLGPKAKGQPKNSPNREKIRAVVQDKSLKGKAKFDAMRAAMGATRDEK